MSKKRPPPDWTLRPREEIRAWARGIAARACPSCGEKKLTLNISDPWIPLAICDGCGSPFEVKPK